MKPTYRPGQVVEDYHALPVAPQPGHSPAGTALPGQAAGKPSG